MLFFFIGDAGEQGASGKQGLSCFLLPVIFIFPYTYVLCLHVARFSQNLLPRKLTDWYGFSGSPALTLIHWAASPTHAHVYLWN